MQQHDSFRTISEKFEMGLYLPEKRKYIGGSWHMYVDVDIDITDIETDIIKHNIDNFDHSVVFPQGTPDAEKLGSLYKRYSIVSLGEEKVDSLDKILAGVCLPIVNNRCVHKCQIVTDDLMYNYTFVKSSYRKGGRYYGAKLQLTTDE